MSKNSQEMSRRESRTRLKQLSILKMMKTVKRTFNHKNVEGKNVESQNIKSQVVESQHVRTKKMLALTVITKKMELLGTLFYKYGEIVGGPKSCLK